ncbi:MAG TPA: ABC transporter ATP-binding protein [Candidatus Bathyarchaeota archaeon]|nr:ABC transporter ATP-binding protein [Candidatus Bathyarchaeota archaeon]
MLRVEGLEASYGRIQVLWGVSLRARRGELTALIGPNGAGKTTTLLAIMGAVRERSGLVEFMGRRVERLPTHRIVELGLCLVPEGRDVFPNMTVEENLLLGAYTKRARRKLHDSLDWVYQLFPLLKERRGQMAGTLSGGEQQMLAMARGIMARPKMLMLDEPSLGLAPKMVLKVFEVLEELRDEGLSMLLVEQNVYHALELASRGYVLERGRIVLEGSGDELLENGYIRGAYLGEV